MSILLAPTLLSGPQGNSTELLVAAASDLSTVSGPLASAFAQRKGEYVRFSFGSSGALARQIENGAPFDVFLSANRKYVADLARAGRLIPETVRVYAEGRLGMWSADGKVRSLRQLLEPGIQRIAIPNPAFAPYGAAARELLEGLGIWQQIQPKVVYGENVRQALQFAETGNADVVITSWSLLANRGAVQLPPGRAPIEQAGAVVAGSKREQLAREFLDFLTGPEGAAIFAAHGLNPPGRGSRQRFSPR